jgi:hypothetical protein
LITSSIFALAARQGQRPSEITIQVMKKRIMRQTPVAWGALQMVQESAEAMAFHLR